VEQDLRVQGQRTTERGVPGDGSQCVPGEDVPVRDVGVDPQSERLAPGRGVVEAIPQGRCDGTPQVPVGQRRADRQRPIVQRGVELLRRSRERDAPGSRELPQAMVELQVGLWRGLTDRRSLAEEFDRGPPDSEEPIQVTGSG